MEVAKDIAERAVIEALKAGAKYADARLEKSTWETVVVKDGKVERVKSGKTKGLGLRVLLKTWGFASCTDLSKKSLQKTVAAAVNMGKSANRARKINLAKIPVKEDNVEVKSITDPFTISLEEKVKLCLDSDRCARVNKFIKRTTTYLACDKTEKFFISSEGAEIAFSNTVTYCETFALAKRGIVVEYMDEMAGGSGGFEIAENFDLPEKAKNVGQKASRLAAAKTIPEKKTTVVLDQDLVALLCHEIIGHPSEADRVLGREAAWAGKAWWAGMNGKRIGSKLLNATDDPRVKGALGYYEYDDEGTPARRKELIREGVLKEHMHSRETAAEFGVLPNGNMRAQSFQYLPLIRMSNTFIEPGDYDMEELFEINDGVYLKGQKIPSIDSKRHNFQISAKEAFLIKRGELTGPFRGASIVGVAPEFFKSVDAVGKDFEMRPVPNCGKGDPMQTIGVGNGGPHLRGVAQVVGVR
ncbi:MAG: TldD/PmbA family protein [Candidatus Hadarchaeum sp.]|uniref:TldD/PmbA family protein n=1 Tax=Candidatus Hadarchaeum sp. TaxID=2883567 RepID=UPI003D11B47F